MSVLHWLTLKVVLLVDKVGDMYCKLGSVFPEQLGRSARAKTLEFSQEFLQENELFEQTKFVQWNLNRDIGMSCGGSVKIYFERFVLTNGKS